MELNKIAHTALELFHQLANFGFNDLLAKSNDVVKHAAPWVLRYDVRVNHFAGRFQQH